MYSAIRPASAPAQPARQRQADAAAMAPQRQRDRHADDEQEGGERQVGQGDAVGAGAGVLEPVRQARHLGDIVDPGHGQDDEAAEGVQAEQAFGNGRGGRRGGHGGGFRCGPRRHGAGEKKGRRRLNRSLPLLRRRPGGAAPRRTVVALAPYLAALAAAGRFSHSVQ
jgi:hypothetical protein